MGENKRAREGVLNQMHDELKCNNQDTKIKIATRNKLYEALKESRKTIKDLQLRVDTMGGTSRLTQLKDEYTELVDKNYKLYEEVNTFQKENNRLTKEIDSLLDSNPDFEDKLDTPKLQSVKGNNSSRQNLQPISQKLQISDLK